MALSYTNTSPRDIKTRRSSGIPRQKLGQLNPWASGLEIANPRLMRATMCRTTTVTGILNNVSCDGAKHHVEATWNKGFMSMLLPPKKEVMEMVIKTNMIRLSKNDGWYVGTIQLGWVGLVNVYGNLRMETDTLLKINGQTANIQQ